MGVASFAYAGDKAQTPPCPQSSEPMSCAAPAAPSDDQNPMPPPPEGNGPGAMCGMGQGGYGNPGPMMHEGRGPAMRGFDRLPKELRDRIDNCRSDREALRDLWVKAVLARGDKSVSSVREEFAKANASLISKIEKEETSIREDIAAIHEGAAPAMGCSPLASRLGKAAHGGMPMGFASDRELVRRIDSEIVSSITALKEPLTVEKYEEIRNAAIAKNIKDFDRRFGDMPMHRPDMMGGMHMMPPMDPHLARMRDEMGAMRCENPMLRHDLRLQLREAMKIKDPVEREAAIKKVLDNMNDGPEEAPAPAEPPASPEAGQAPAAK